MTKMENLPGVVGGQGVSTAGLDKQNKEIVNLKMGQLRLFSLRNRRER